MQQTMGFLQQTTGFLIFCSREISRASLCYSFRNEVEKKMMKVWGEICLKTTENYIILLCSITVPNGLQDH